MFEFQIFMKPHWSDFLWGANQKYLKSLNEDNLQLMLTSNTEVWNVSVTKIYVIRIWSKMWVPLLIFKCKLIGPK